MVLLSLIFICTQGKSQEPNEEIDSLLWKEISALVYLDSLTIKPENNELDIDSFVRLVLNDESFYLAFTNLRIHEHKFNQDIRFFDKKGNEQDFYRGIHFQKMNNLCRQMQIITSESSPSYRKKKNEYRYITSKIIDRVFYTHGEICADTTINYIPEPANKFETNIENLKTVIFKPGKDVKVPLVGNKMSIFSQEMRKYYDYSVTHIPYNDNFSYIFDVVIKPEYANNNTKTVIRKMRTYFDAETFKILARDYLLRYKAGIYSFDIKIDVTLTKWNEAYLPKNVRYSGYWKLIGRKAERCDFTFIFSDYNF